MLKTSLNPAAEQLAVVLGHYNLVKIKKSELPTMGGERLFPLAPPGSWSISIEIVKLSKSNLILFQTAFWHFRIAKVAEPIKLLASHWLITK